MYAMGFFSARLINTGLCCAREKLKQRDEMRISCALGVVEATSDGEGEGGLSLEVKSEKEPPIGEKRAPASRNSRCKG